MRTNIEYMLDKDFAGGVFVIPNWVESAIADAIDKALVDAPDEAEDDRPYFREMLLRFFNEQGHLPEFTLVRREP